MVATAQESVLAPYVRQCLILRANKLAQPFDLRIKGAKTRRKLIVVGHGIGVLARGMAHGIFRAGIRRNVTRLC